MTIGRILWWVYSLDILDVILLLAGCTILFCSIELKLEHRGWWRWLAACLLMVLVATIFYTTIGNRSEKGDLQLNLIPFHSYREVLAGGNPEIYRSNFMNAVLFYPAGLLATSLLPKKWHGWCKCLLVVTLLGSMSIGIEYLQYRYTLGLCEIDDVIHNTVGTFVGGLAALLIPPLLCLIKDKS